MYGVQSAELKVWVIVIVGQDVIADGVMRKGVSAEIQFTRK